MAMDTAASSVPSSKYKYLSEPDDKLKCCICLDVAEKPQQEANCGKLFCRDCIKQYGETKTCPHCRKQPNYFSDKKSSQDIREIGIYCKYAATGCSWIGTMGTLGDHVIKSCDFAEIPCKYNYIGCKEKGNRKHIKEHEGDVVAHWQLALATIHIMKEGLHSGKRFAFKLTEFKSLQDKRGGFRSQPFSSDQGYTMCVFVDPCGCGDGRGTHVSVGIELLPGPGDSGLNWPFKGAVTITLLNQLANDNHHSKLFKYDAFVSQCGHPRGPRVGDVCFIAHSSVIDHINNIQYLKDDSLYFNITVLEDKHWLRCT